MTAHASYIFAAYSFIHSLPKDQLLQVGYLTAEGSPIPSFDENLLINICEDAQKIFENEQNIIEIDDDVIIVGDIHGSFHDLLRILSYIETCNSKVVFLGDYVDRGNFSLECITLLFALKVLKPKQYFLLRGNHEFDDMGSHYGFKKEILNYHNPKRTKIIPVEQKKTKIVDEIDFNIDEEDEPEKSEEESNESCEDRCDNYFANHVNINCYKYSEKLYNSFMTAFSYLPFCSIINKTSLCIHGGLTPLLDKFENINKQIQRPITDFDENLLLSDILWSDPSMNLPQLYGDSQRGRGKLFNGAVVVNFLKHNNLKRLIRGHECVNAGVESLFNDKCITVFSASSYNRDMGNSSGILKIYHQDDTIEPIIFPPLQRLKKCDTNYYKVQSYEQTESTEIKLSLKSRKVSEYKSGFLSNFVHVNQAHSVQNIKSQCNLSLYEENNISEHDLAHKNHLQTQTPYLRKNKGIMSGITCQRSMPRMKVGSINVLHVFKTPHICTPQMQHHDLTSKSESSE